MKLTKKQKIKDLKQIIKNLGLADNLQNQSNCLLHKYLDIDEFYNIWHIDTFSALYNAKAKAIQLLNNLENNN